MIDRTSLVIAWMAALVGCHAAIASAPTRPSAEPVKAAAVPATSEPIDEAQALADLERRAASFVDAFSNRHALLSADGAKLVFRSNRGGGEYRLFSADVADPSGTPTALLEGQERLEAVDFDHARAHLYFLQDQGRNEQKHLFRMSPDGSSLRELVTPPQGARVESFQLSEDDRTLVYVLADQKSGTHTLFAAAADGANAREVHAFEGFAFVSDVDPLGRRALVMHIESLSRRVTYLVDLRTGDAKRLAPHQGLDAKAFAIFGPAGRDFFVATDEGAARTRLVRLSEHGKELASYSVPDGEIDLIELSHDGRTLAVEVQRGALLEVHLLDPTRLELRAKPDLPAGFTELGRFSADGKRLTVSFSSANLPGDVYAVDVGTGAATPLRRDARAGLDEITDIRYAHEDIPSVDGLRVPTDVYLPAHAGAGQKVPVIVELHGGPASVSPIAYDSLKAFRLASGYAVVTPNVRGSTGFGSAYEKADNGALRVAAFADLEAVNRWVRAQPWADPDRIVVYGGSYGGYLVYIALTRQPALWAAGIALVGPVNLESFLASTTGAIRLAFREEFGDLETDRELLRSLSPVHDVAAIRAPLFVYQGEHDPRVPRSESEQVVNGLRARGHAVEYMLAKGEGHSVSLRENRLAFYARTARFLQRGLGLHQPDAHVSVP